MIVMSMCDKSSILYNSGYAVLKCVLEVHSQSFFAQLFKNLKSYFSESGFVFVIEEQLQKKGIVESKAKRIGVKRLNIVSISKDIRRNQCKTVTQEELEHFGYSKCYYDEKITICNIDSIQISSSFPIAINNCNSYLKLSERNGSNWSFAKEDEIYITPTHNYSTQSWYNIDNDNSTMNEVMFCGILEEYLEFKE